MQLTENNIKKEIKHYKDMLKRKERSDKGTERAQYSTSLNKQYVTYLKRANAKGFGFELTEAHFENVNDLPCEYCGNNSTGYDRVDSKKGYLLNNIVPCCYRCNMMKHTLTAGEFIKRVEAIYNHLNRL